MWQSLFYVHLHIQRTYFLHIPLSPLAKQDRLLTTLPATQKTLFT